MKKNYPQQNFSSNTSLLKRKASKPSIYGVAVALTAIIIATILSGYFNEGEISVASFARAQKTNIVLWILDVMPFVFAFWGQYVSTMLSREASTIIVNQTHELRSRTELIEKKAAY